MKRALAVLLLVVAPLAAADDADVEKGLQNLANIFRLGAYFELKRARIEVPEIPPMTDPWGTPYGIDREEGRVVGAGSDRRFDTADRAAEQFAGTESDVFFANGNFVRTNHNWLCAHATPAMAAAMAAMRRQESLLLMARTERARLMMARELTLSAMRKDDVTAETRDAWGTPLRIVEENGKRRIISAGADRAFQPMTWNREPAIDAAEDIVFEDGQFVRLADEKALAMKTDGTAKPLPQPLEPAMRDDPNNKDYLRVGNGVAAPVVTTRVEPVYPEAYRMLRISGIVILEMVISETGTVERIGVLKSLGPALDAAGIEAVKKWKFAPATRDGKPVPVLFSLTINFKLT